MSSPGTDVSPTARPEGGRIGLLALVCLIFFTVSGGPYGLETLVGEVGPGWAVVLIALTPLLWALPTALMVAELSAAIPEEGGYFVWVRRALGDFWGVQEGWWTIGYTAVDLAIYPVLFVNYLAFFVPGLALDEDGGSTWGVFGARWLVALALIGVALALNLRGAGAVGKNATWTIVVVLGVFAVLSVLGLARGGAAAEAVGAVRRGLGEGGMGGSLAVGLAAVLWNYCGWDNVSTYAGDVREPGRNYPRALLITLPLIAASYLIPVLAGIGTTTDPEVWSESKGWPVIAAIIAGPWFGRAVAVAALVSAWSLFNSQLLYVARLPAAMAREGWLPAPLGRVSARTGVPTTALVTSCLITAVCVALPFAKLVVIDILLYAAGLSLEFVALIVLRLREPALPRPFRVPGGLVGTVVVLVLPMALAGVVVYQSFVGEEGSGPQLVAVLAVLASGVVLYFARRSRARDLASKQAG